MPEYIEKGKVINVLTAAGVADSDKRRRTWARAICKVDGIPAADVAPVVHGTWTDIGMDYKKCSKCGEAYNDIFCNPLNYCPNCGAKCIMHPSIPHGTATESEV